MDVNISMNFKDYLYTDADAFYKNAEGKLYPRSVHSKDHTRINKAKEQLKKYADEKWEKAESINKITECVNEFLTYNNIIEKKVCHKREISDIDYNEIKEKYGLKDKGDIIWLKFADNGCLGVVAAGADINFNIPASADKYNDKKPGNGKKYVWNTSGILLHKLGLKWDTSFVLVFPLKEIPKGYKRHDVEKAVGNYLIECGMPVIDYFSHMY